MKIHKDEFYKILQNVINEYDKRIKMTIQVIEPMSFFKKDKYSNVMDIIKSLMYKEKYIYEKNYPEYTTNYIIGIYNKIIKELCNYIYNKCSEYNQNDFELNKGVEIMFDVSEPIEDKKTQDGKLILRVSDVGKFNYPPINKADIEDDWFEKAMAEALKTIAEYNSANKD